MPETIDWPPPRSPRSPISPRRRVRLILTLVFAALVIVFGGRIASSYYVDALWFGSLGYAEVFWKTLSFQAGVFRGLCRGHVSDSIRIVPGPEAGAP